MAGERIESRVPVRAERLREAETSLARFGPPVLVLALLAATVFAFVHTEREKLAPSPITATRVDRYVAPECECKQAVAFVQFRVRRAETVSVEIVDDGGAVVRRIVDGRSLDRPGVVRTRWDGRDADGRVVADAAYRPRVRLERSGRTFVLPNRIQLDTAPPRIETPRQGPLARNPNHAYVDYRVSEPARVVLLVNGEAAVRSKESSRGRLFWRGRLGGRRVRPGRYRIQLSARDLAGNLAPRTRGFVLRVR